MIEAVAERVCGVGMVGWVPLRLERMHAIGAEYHQGGLLFLLYFFAAALTSLRTLQKSTNRKKTRRQLGIHCNNLLIAFRTQR